MTAVSNPIVAPLTGIDFLAASHFKIAQEPSATPDALHSVFKHDYKAPYQWRRQSASEPPRPAQFMHADTGKIGVKISETRQAFPEKRSEKMELKDKYTSLQATNFKSDADKRIDSFQTTNTAYFPAKPLSVTKPSKDPHERMTSYIPQGDKEKAPNPVSDYRDSFQGHDTANVVTQKAPNMHTSGPPTILGDDRTHSFATTSTRAFDGQWLPPVEPVPKQTRSSVPMGDPFKVKHEFTTKQVSFQAHPSAQMKGYDRSGTMGKLQVTNFKLGDGNGRYLSTAAESYTPMWGGERCDIPKHKRNDSSLPQGDLDPYRSQERTNTTTNRWYLQKHDLSGRAKPISGATLRTKSTVQLNEPPLDGRFYSTTNASTFTPKSVPYARVRGGQPSVVPLDYYGDAKTDPTSWSDFPSHVRDNRVPVMRPNPEALDNLRDAHFGPPLGGERYFETTHRKSYPAKTMDRINVIPGTLQKSSVPLGTLGKYIAGYHV
ncbi:hypothetical protein Bbelb_264710 [Branchiostoma belcheri]|nr:hypothetical protein Bbelb_264710 [Branchiostoma belcheri]